MRFMARRRQRIAACVILGSALVVAVATARAATTGTLDVDVSRPGHAIPASFFGLMTEEINHAYDGGLYAELIQNRTFQDPGRPGAGMPVHWSLVGSAKASTDRANPVNSALPVSLRVELAGGDGGVANDGYWGIPVRPDTTYTATFYARAGGGAKGPIVLSLRTDDGDVTVARASTQAVTGTWRKYTIGLKTGHDAPTTAKARFLVTARGPGRFWLSYVSLFPPTYKGATNGLRPDLMELMAAMRPKFIRLPGGNYSEGGRFADRFNWKQMIGPPDRRPGHMGCWGYRSSDGLGLPEFLLWCKQLGAEPVVALFAGYVLNGDHVWPGSPEMALYTQEALDEIEYITGPATSKWGKVRAADGFPEPFPLRYVEVGNEDWFDRSGSYDGRFTQMAKAIRARYPQLKIIASAPVKSFKPDLYDDHFYRSPRQLFQMSTLYDKPAGPVPPITFEGGGWSGRQPDGIRTFVGEWAAHSGTPTTDLSAALADAAFVMGLEKNSDAVPMECYAPLLTNVNPADPAKGYPKGWQWNYNLIGYDALRSFGAPSYHAQVMLAQNKGDVVLPAKLGAPPAARNVPAPRGGIGVGSWRTQVEYTDLSVAAPDGGALLTPEALRNQGSWQLASEDWDVQDQAIRTRGANTETWAITGDRAWTDYTIHLRARKHRGQEGFIVLWHAVDRDRYHWWNVGGWGNTLARCEVAEGGDRRPYGTGTPFTVETGRWYDLRLVVTGDRARGYVDGKLVTDTTYEAGAAPSSVFATATLDKGDRAVLVKVVNVGAEPVDLTINLRGVAALKPQGTAIVLSGQPGDVNSLEEPRKVAPRVEAVTVSGPSFRRTFPPFSFTVLRLSARAGQNRSRQ